MSDYPEPDPLPPPLPIFNSVNWPQIETSTGGGGGGGGFTIDTQQITLTGNTGNVEIILPANTFQFTITIVPYKNSGGIFYWRLGDDTTYYMNNYYISNLGSIGTAFERNLPNDAIFCQTYTQTPTTCSFQAVEVNTVGIASTGVIGGVLFNTSTPITRVEYYLTGGNTMLTNTNFEIVSYVL